MTNILKVCPAFPRRGVQQAMAGLLVCAATAFGPATAAAPAQPGAAAQAQNPAHAPGTASAKSAVTPPDAATSLYYIYDVDGHGADSYEVANGSVATYWHGHAFEHDGKRYFTGFAWNTAARYGKAGEHNPGPDTQVNLAEVTFVLTHHSADKPWSFRGMEPTIGDFGAYETAPEVDTRRKTLEHRTPSGKQLIAVPISTFDRGTSVDGYTLLLFNPKRLEADGDENVWSYVGNLIAGEENAAACDDGAVMPCIANKGELSFAQGTEDLPAITVTFTGDTIAGPDKTRKLGPADAKTYRFDPARKAYASR